jgi:hypothetical protein
LKLAGWAAFPPESSGEDASASKKSETAPPPAAVTEYPWNAFGGSFPNVVTRHGAHDSPTASESGDRMRQGGGAAQSSKPEEVQPGHDATAGQNPTEAAIAWEAPAELVPEDPEYSTFNYWRQPVESLIDEEA